MKQHVFAVGAVFLLCLGMTAVGQTTQPSDDIDLAPGFKMRTSGGIDIGKIYCEVVQFGTDWKETEEHDVFNPQISSPDDKTHVATGTFTAPGGTFNLAEKAIAAGASGIQFTASVSSEKEVDCNELSVTFDLPVELVGGKQITVDGEQVTLPMAPAKQGEAHLYDKEIAKEIVIPTADGTLTITGQFPVLVQDDREWGDQRYAVRIQFSPGDGGIKESKIEVGMKWTPGS